MAIERKFAGRGREMEPGEHKVTIVDIKLGKSKSGKNMWTISFVNHAEEKILGYFCPDVPFHLKQLKELKLAAGLDEKAGPDQLMNKRIGIAVDAEEPDADGKTWMRITGYGKESLVENDQSTQKYEPLPTSSVDEIPF